VSVNEFPEARERTAANPAEESQSRQALEKPGEMKIAGTNPSIFFRKNNDAETRRDSSSIEICAHALDADA